MSPKEKIRVESTSWEHKYKELRKECRRLRGALAQVQTERDAYRKSFLALTNKPFSFTDQEVREMEKHPAQLEDVLEELLAPNGKSGFGVNFRMRH